MAKRLTLAQQKRLVQEIMSKTLKLYTNKGQLSDGSFVVSVKDVEVLEKMCTKWMKRINNRR